MAARFDIAATTLAASWRISAHTAGIGDARYRNQFGPREPLAPLRVWSGQKVRSASLARIHHRHATEDFSGHLSIMTNYRLTLRVFLMYVLFNLHIRFQR